MTALSKTIFGAALSVGALAFFSVSVSAAVVCSRNACWHTHESYEYPPEAGVVVHPDDWHWGRREHFVWREHEGRGYWRGGRWMQFEPVPGR
jgi:hypothetical protein